MKQTTITGIQDQFADTARNARTCVRANRERRGAGYTLVELMVSLALTTLLVLAVLGVTVRLAGHRRMLEREHPFLPWRDRLTDQLASDYANCQSIIVRPRQILMETIGTQNTDYSTARQVPAVVVYSVMELSGRSTTVRVSKCLGSDDSDQSLVRNVMCEGVVRFKPLERLQTDVPPRFLPLSFECIPDSGTDWTVVLVRDGVPR